MEKANNSNATATNLPPKSPRIPCENALAVNSAELTKDLPSIMTYSLILPLLTFIIPENNSASVDEITTSSAIDLE